MPEKFKLPVEYKGQQYLFETTLNVYPFTHKFIVDIHGNAILFEPDEEGSYRAVQNYSEIENSKSVDIDLLMKVAESLEELVK